MSTNEPPSYPGSDSNDSSSWGSTPPAGGQQPPVPGSPPPPSYGGQQPPPPPGYGYGAPGGYRPPQTSQKATWAMVIGIVSLVCTCLGFGGIAAIIMGRQARREIAASNGALQGDGQAQAGFILGIIALVIFVGLVVLYVGLFAIGISAGEFSEY